MMNWMYIHPANAAKLHFSYIAAMARDIFSRWFNNVLVEVAVKNIWGLVVGG